MQDIDPRSEGTGALLRQSEHHSPKLVLINTSNHEKKKTCESTSELFSKAILTAGRGHTAVLRPARQRFQLDHVKFKRGNKKYINPNSYCILKQFNAH